MVGVIISFDNQSDVELARRFSSAWAAFFKFAPLLTCKATPLCTRLSILARGIHPSLFWCAGSWNLRLDQLSKMRDSQRSMIRKMLRFTRKDAEPIGDFMQRTNRNISNLMLHHDVVLWDVMTHRAVFRSGGKLVQMQCSAPSRLTTIVFRYRDWAWIQIVAGQNNGRQLHGRILKTWRWERPLYKAFGDD